MDATAGVQPDLPLLSKKASLLVTFRAACRAASDQVSAYATILISINGSAFAPVAPTAGKGWFCLPSSAGSPEGFPSSVAGVVEVPAAAIRVRVLVTPQGTDPLPATTLKDVLLTVEG